MGVNTTGLLNAQAEVYASYKNDAVTKNETAAKKDSTAKTEELILLTRQAICDWT